MKTATHIKRSLKAKLLVAVLCSTIQCQGLKVENKKSLNTSPVKAVKVVKSKKDCKKEIKASLKRSIEKLKSLEPSVVSNIYVAPETLQEARRKQERLVTILNEGILNTNYSQELEGHIQFFQELSNKYPKKVFFQELANWSKISKERMEYVAQSF